MTASNADWPPHRDLRGFAAYAAWELAHGRQAETWVGVPEQDREAYCCAADAVAAMFMAKQAEVDIKLIEQRQRADVYRADVAKLVLTSELASQRTEEVERDYVDLVDAIDEYLDPHDDDAAAIAIYCEAVEAAGRQLAIARRLLGDRAVVLESYESRIVLEAAQLRRQEAIVAEVDRQIAQGSCPLCAGVIAHAAGCAAAADQKGDIDV